MATGATPNSAINPYATAADLTDLRDWRWLADRLSDDNTRPANAAAVQAHSLVARALRWASAEIESAVTCGNRYRPEDLIELTETQTVPTAQGGDGSTQGYVVAKEMVIGLCCDLAAWWLEKRRKPGAKPETVAGVAEAFATLDRLRIGERVFPIADSQSAGLPDVVAVEESTDLEQAGIPMTERAIRFFGGRR